MPHPAPIVADAPADVAAPDTATATAADTAVVVPANAVATESPRAAAAADGDYRQALRERDGLDGAADQVLALALFERAAAAGHADAQFELARAYHNGQGVQPDEAMAITWYRAAASAGHEQARRELEAIYAAAGLPMPNQVRPGPRPVAPTANVAPTTAPSVSPVAPVAAAATLRADSASTVAPASVPVGHGVSRPDPIELGADGSAATDSPQEAFEASADRLLGADSDDGDEAPTADDEVA